MVLANRLDDIVSQTERCFDFGSVLDADIITHLSQKAKVAYRVILRVVELLQSRHRLLGCQLYSYFVCIVGVLAPFVAYRILSMAAILCLLSI